MNRIRLSPLWFTFLIIVLPLIIFHSLGLEQAAAWALFVSVVILWISEFIPLAATALLVPVLGVTYGILPGREAFSAFGNEILFLFMGTFFLATSMQKHGLDKRIAYFFMAHPFIDKSPVRVITMVTGICWVISMWVSNTATCAMMLPMCMALSKIMGENLPDEKSRKHFTYRILLTCAFACSIGGMATPVGTPPNMLALQFLKDRGIQIDFLEWMSFGVPISLMTLGLCSAILHWLYPIAHFTRVNVSAIFRDKLSALGKLSAGEKQTSFCFSVMILLWILPEVLSFLPGASQWSKNVSTHMSTGVAALVGSLPLFVFSTQKNERHLTWEDATTIEWGTILLFGGGICLGMILDKSGLSATFGKSALYMASSHLTLTLLVAGAFAIILSEFCSNTAAASILIPVLLSNSASLSTEFTQALVVMATLGASFGFMLPISTPPNAIVYSSGALPAREMLRAGILLDILGLLALVVSMWMFFAS